MICVEETFRNLQPVLIARVKALPAVSLIDRHRRLVRVEPSRPLDQALYTYHLVPDLHRVEFGPRNRKPRWTRR